MSPTSRHRNEVKPLTSDNDAGGKITTYEYVGEKPSNRYRSTYQPMEIMLGRGPFMGITLSIVYSFFQDR